MISLEAYTVSRAKTIYHAIAGSGAKISVNFMDVGLFFHIVFPLDTWDYFICFPLYMEIFPGVFNGCMNNFHGNISMALNTNTANLGVTGSNPKQKKKQFAR